MVKQKIKLKRHTKGQTEKYEIYKNSILMGIYMLIEMPVKWCIKSIMCGDGRINGHPLKTKGFMVSQ